MIWTCYLKGHRFHLANTAAIHPTAYCTRCGYKIEQRVITGVPVAPEGQIEQLIDTWIGSDVWDDATAQTVVNQAEKIKELVLVVNELSEKVDDKISLKVIGMFNDRLKKLEAKEKKS